MASRKQSVEWHKECLKNFLVWIESQKDELRRLTAKIERWERECDYQQAQIERAEAENITEFDAEKFKPKKKREAN